MRSRLGWLSFGSGFADIVQGARGLALVVQDGEAYFLRQQARPPWPALGFALCASPPPCCVC